jgi:hypothetical protein
MDAMAIRFVPAEQDVERYRRLRAISNSLNTQLCKTIPVQAYEEIGDAIGIRHNGILVLNDPQEESCVIADCCVYDWYRGGANLVQQYSETHPLKPGTDEGFVLQAACNARYRVLIADKAVPGAGLYCRDVLNGGELFLMDIAFSRNLAEANTAIATRTIPLGEYWMTTGASLPIDLDTDLTASLHELEDVIGESLAGPGLMPLAIVRACLAAGAAERIVYSNPRDIGRTARREPRWPGFKRRRRR